VHSFTDNSALLIEQFEVTGVGKNANTARVVYIEQNTSISSLQSSV